MSAELTKKEWIELDKAVVEASRYAMEMAANWDILELTCRNIRARRKKKKIYTEDNLLETLVVCFVDLNRKLKKLSDRIAALEPTPEPEPDEPDEE